MEKQALIKQIRLKKSYLCVGLDTDIEKIPACLAKEPDPVFAFNRLIIEAVSEFCVSFKPNIAFYEASGAKGWESLQKTMEIVPRDIFTIADAKRGDIGNTSGLYARTFFETYAFDAVTLAPYMGSDSVMPFLDYADKWVVLLAYTSNPSNQDFQELRLAGGSILFEEVIRRSQEWAGDNKMMYVVGATDSERLRHIRALVPEHFLLVPGVGAQGGSLAEVSAAGLSPRSVALLVNASRSILYASSGSDFAEKARREAQKLQEEMALYLDQYCPEQ